MKKTTYFLVAFLGLLFFKSILSKLSYNKFTNDYIKVASEALNEDEVQQVKDLSDDILKKREYEKNIFSSDSIRQLFNVLSRRNKNKILKANFGNYEGLKFHSLMKSKTGNKLRFKIYRFKGVFDTDANVEIRTTINSENKFTSLYVFPWKEKLF